MIFQVHKTIFGPMRIEHSTSTSSGKQELIFFSVARNSQIHHKGQNLCLLECVLDTHGMLDDCDAGVDLALLLLGPAAVQSVLQADWVGEGAVSGVVAESRPVVGVEQGVVLPSATRPSRVRRFQRAIGRNIRLAVNHRR